MLELIGTIFGSIFAGGATGLIGVAVQRIADYQNRKLDIESQKSKQDHEVAMKNADAAIMEKEWAARTRVAEVELEGKKEQADGEGFAKSFGMEPPKYAEGKLSTGQLWIMVVLDFLRGIVRPGLTIYLAVITTKIYLHAHAMLMTYGITMTSTQALDLVKLIISTILYLFTTCVLWWFGTRNRQQAPQAKLT